MAAVEKFRKTHWLWPGEKATSLVLEGKSTVYASLLSTGCFEVFNTLRFDPGNDAGVEFDIKRIEYGVRPKAIDYPYRRSSKILTVELFDEADNRVIREMTAGYNITNRLSMGSRSNCSRHTRGVENAKEGLLWELKNKMTI